MIFSPSFSEYQSALALISATDRAKKAPVVLIRDKSAGTLLGIISGRGVGVDVGGEAVVQAVIMLPIKKIISVTRGKFNFFIYSAPFIPYIPTLLTQFL